MRTAGICFNHQPPLHRRRDGGRNGFRMAGWSPLRPATGPPVRSWPASRAGPGRAHCGASSSSKGTSPAAAAAAKPAAGAAAAPPPLLMSRCFQACASSVLDSLPLQHDVRPWWARGARSTLPLWCWSLAKHVWPACRCWRESSLIKGKLIF